MTDYRRACSHCGNLHTSGCVCAGARDAEFKARSVVAMKPAKRRPVVAKRATTETPRQIATRIVTRTWPDYDGIRERSWPTDLVQLRDRIQRALTRERRAARGRGHRRAGRDKARR